MNRLLLIAITALLFSCKKSDNTPIPTIKFTNTALFKSNSPTSYPLSNQIQSTFIPDSITTKAIIHANGNLKQISFYTPDSLKPTNHSDFTESINEFFKLSNFQSSTVDTLYFTLYPNKISQKTSLTIQVFDDNNRQSNQTLLIEYYLHQ